MASLLFIVTVTRLAFIHPLVPSSAAHPPKGDGWLHEPKWDGFRFQIVKDGERVRGCSQRAAPNTASGCRACSMRSLRCRHVRPCSMARFAPRWR